MFRGLLILATLLGTAFPAFALECPKEADGWTCRKGEAGIALTKGEMEITVAEGDAGEARTALEAAQVLSLRLKGTPPETEGRTARFSVARKGDDRLVIVALRGRTFRAVMVRGGSAEAAAMASRYLR